MLQLNIFNPIQKEKSSICHFQYHSEGTNHTEVGTNKWKPGTS